ncbi:uncharacterized protein EHS24_007729 [Apiotrichum porosum]|uniref:DUF4097 domain-containing protein n=1 Tax=Apiotrichum porosum TaxID=105984 RepID=A0A427XVH8_9TREE|nr:uncharacterized protein EHS24_007729 [Apiotrichum porosum]RSH82735.1 hypothetical protein EHS24_007729 [Apiotrichum porosum]
MALAPSFHRSLTTTTMPIFKTPHPISITIRALYAESTVTAGDGARDTDSTTVEITPYNPSNAKDVDEAKKITVEQPTSGQIVITAPPPTWSSIFTRGTAVIRVVSPMHSSVDASARKGAISVAGDVTNVVLKAGSGALRVDSADKVEANTGNGTIVVGRCRGPLNVQSHNGAVTVDYAGADAVVQTSNGALKIGKVVQALQAHTANGAVTVDEAGADVDATTHNGLVRLSYVSRGAIRAKTNNGKVWCGIARDTRIASIDAHTVAGRVHNSITDNGGSKGKVNVRLNTNSGDIYVDRADAPPSGGVDSVAEGVGRLDFASASGSGSNPPPPPPPQAQHIVTEEQDWGPIPPPSQPTYETLPPRYNQDWRVGETAPPGSTTGK